MSIREARRAEAEGRFREAAALYAEAGARPEAAAALLFHASRVTSPRERAEAFTASLRFLADDDPKRDEVELQIALARLEAAMRAGPGDAAARDDLRASARTLARLGRDAEAASVWELLGDADEQAAALERAGEIEKLEALLERRAAVEQSARSIAGLVRDAETMMQGGARRDARRALAEAARLAPEDAQVRELLRRLEARLPAAWRVELRVGGTRVVLAGRLPVGLGRDAEVPVRGPTVSRRHAELVEMPDGVVVRDLGSRNGTLVARVPLGAPLVLGDEGVVIGLGEDVDVWVAREGRGVRGEVRRGPDRSLRFVAGPGVLAVPGARATVTFDAGVATLEVERGVRATLDGAACVAPIDVLRDDVVEVDGVRIEVVA